MAETAREIRLILDTDLAFFLYYRGEVIGTCLILPDVNPLLKRINGRLNPVSLIKIILYRRDVKGLRGLVFGIKEHYHQTGAPRVAFHYLSQIMSQKTQYEYIELGWNLEDNYAINLLYEEGGIRPSKRYRIYRKDLI